MKELEETVAVAAAEEKKEEELEEDELIELEDEQSGPISSRVITLTGARVSSTVWATRVAVTTTGANSAS